MKEQYQKYYDAFVAEGKPRVKPGIGMILQFFPFTGGALVYIELQKGMNDNAMQRKAQDSLDEALLHTRLFDVAVCNRFKGKKVNSTLYYLISARQYLVFKSNAEKEWTDQAASNDFLEIVKRAKEKYGKK